MTKRLLIIGTTIAFAIALVLAGDPVRGLSGFYGVSVAKAQRVRKKHKVRTKKRRNFLEILFGAPRRQAVTRRKMRKTTKVRRRKKHGRKTIIAAPVLAPVEKLENARIVLVVGDFFAGSLAKGLVRTFSQTPAIRIVTKYKGSSGFVREDYYNWTAEIGPIIDALKPSVVVVMIGTNDRQLLRASGKKLQKRTEPWDAVYKQRIESFASAINAKKVPALWMGLPPVRFRAMNKDFLFFNETYRAAIEKIGGHYIDIWDGFSNEEGAFVTSGPDVNGRIVRLRAKDGINVTKAGQNKLAFYAEKGIRKITGVSAAEVFAGLPDDFSLPKRVLEPTYDPQKTGRTIVMRLDDPALDGGNVLAGGDVASIAKNASKPNQAGIVTTARAMPLPSRQIGRADDTSWPRKQYERPKPAPAMQLPSASYKDHLSR